MNKIMEIVFGSHLYGLNNKNSDKDYKGIYLPTLEELLLNTYKQNIITSSGNNNSKNGAGDVDEEWIALPKFLEMACKGETVALDMLHGDNKFVTKFEYGHIWDDLVSKRTMFYSKNLKAYMGYVKHQAAKYGIKGSRMNAMQYVIDFIETNFTNKQHKLSYYYDSLKEDKHLIKGELVNKDGVKTRYYEVAGKKHLETVGLEHIFNTINKAYDAYGHRAKEASENKNIDWKAISHSLRVGYQLRDIFTKGTFSFPLAETEFLLKVKEGKRDFTSEVAPSLEKLVDDIETMAEFSSIPDNVNTEYWSKWLLDVYKEDLIN